jgi:hypothetical protein
MTVQSISQYTDDVLLVPEMGQYKSNVSAAVVCITSPEILIMDTKWDVLPCQAMVKLQKQRNPQTDASQTHVAQQHNADFTFLTHHGKLPLNWILLDNQSTINVFCKTILYHDDFWHFSTKKITTIIFSGLLWI